MLASTLSLLYLAAALTLPTAQSHPLQWWPRTSETGTPAWSFFGLLFLPDARVTVVRNEPVTFAARPATFGGALARSRLGYVIPLSAFTRPCAGIADEEEFMMGNDTLAEETKNLGCPRLCTIGEYVPDPSEPWIALVQRGECAFVDKAREAQRLGAGAVIVGGDDPAGSGHADDLVQMWGPGITDDLKIEASYIMYRDYQILFSLIESSETVHSGLQAVTLLITSDTTGGWFSPALTFISILLLPSLLTFVTLLIHRFRAVRAAQRERAPEDIVRSLPWRVWTGHGWEKHAGLVPGHEHPCTSPPMPDAGAHIDLERGVVRPSTSDGDDNADEPAWAEAQNECAICLSEFEVGDKVRVLPCSHLFHLDEIDAWLINSRKLCPVCKADVTQPPSAHHGHTPEAAQPGAEGGAEDTQPDGPSPSETTPLLSGQGASRPS